MADGAATVADLLTTLETTGLRLASGGAGRGLPVSRPVVHDAWSPLPDLRGGLLLGAGMHAGRADASAVVSDAAEHGFTAVVVKARGGDVDTLAATADRAGVALLVADDEVEWRQLDALVTAALASATQVGRSLSTVAVGDLFTLANAVAALIGGATAVEDAQQRVLAYSTLADQPIDEDRRQGILGRQVPDLPENAEQYRELFRSGSVCRFPATAPALPRLAIAVRAGSELVGSIWVVDATGELGPEADRGLEGAAEIAALHLLRARSGEDLARRQRGELLRQLLTDPGDAALVVDQLGLGPGGPFVVLAFRPQQAADRPDELSTTRLVDLVTLHCESHQGRSGCAAVGGTVYALFRASEGRGAGYLTGLAGDVVARAGRSLRVPLLAAVGSRADAVEQIAGSRRDADLVLRLLRSRPELGPVAAAEDRYSSLLLVELAQHLEDNPRLVSPKAVRVVEHDTRRDGRYAETVGAYLDCLQDVGAAAARLRVHPNTLRYRLRRAVELFDLHLDDPDEVLTLWLALRARRERQAVGAPAVSARR